MKQQQHQAAIVDVMALCCKKTWLLKQCCTKWLHCLTLLILLLSHGLPAHAPDCLLQA